MNYMSDHLLNFVTTCLRTCGDGIHHHRLLLDWRCFSNRGKWKILFVKTTLFLISKKLQTMAISSDLVKV